MLKSGSIRTTQLMYSGCCFLFLCAATLGTDTSGCAMFPNPTGTGLISGAVQAAETRQPISNVEVMGTLYSADGKPQCWWKQTARVVGAPKRLSLLPEVLSDLAHLVGTPPHTP